MAENVDDFIAGWVSGAVATVMTQPFDMAVTRMQASGRKAPLTQLKSLMRLDYSLGAAWRGVGPLLIGTPFNNALIFLGYGMGKRFAETGDDSPNRYCFRPRPLARCNSPPTLCADHGGLTRPSALVQRAASCPSSLAGVPVDLHSPSQHPLLSSSKFVFN